MARHKNANWNVDDWPTTEGAILTVLMDLRDELQAMRRLMECQNVQAGFIGMQSAAKTLRSILRKLPLQTFGKP